MIWIPHTIFGPFTVFLFQDNGVHILTIGDMEGKLIFLYLYQFNTDTGIGQRLLELSVQL